MTPEIILLNDLKTPQKWSLAFPRPLNNNLSSWHLYISYDFRRCNCLKIGSEYARKLLDVMIRIAFLEFVKFIICIMLSPP